MLKALKKNQLIKKKIKKILNTKHPNQNKNI